MSDADAISLIPDFERMEGQETISLGNVIGAEYFRVFNYYVETKVRRAGDIYQVICL